MALLEVADLLVEREAGVLLEVPALLVEAGQLAVVTGPTDSGKSLLAAVLAGLAAPTSGTVTLDGSPLLGGPLARRRRGLAATVADGTRLGGCSVAEALRLAGPRRAPEAMRRFPLLAARGHVDAALLSGGEHQLLLVACAWAGAPRVLVLDSPTTGLAAAVAADVAALARECAADGAAVLWLDQLASAAPAPAACTLSGGRLSAVAPAGG
ncbi:MAG: ATP-binding cassette domain-containing protein [Candidatus Dormibacteria bacterium]